MLTARDIPNMISVARIILVFPVVWLLLTGQFRMAMLLFFVAGVSDALDGFLAKHFGWQSRLGGILDPLADKFLLVSAFLCLGWLGSLPWWLIAMVVLRDIVIVGGALVYNYRVAQLDAQPTLISKLNTLLQIVLVLAVVYDLGFSALHTQLITVLIWSVVCTILLSGLGYVLDWGRRAKRKGGEG
jgi:cardiolipin synthase